MTRHAEVRVVVLSATILVLAVLLLVAWTGLSRTVWAQESGIDPNLDPMFAIAGYTTDDPIDPLRFGLATPDGRFAIATIDCQADGCAPRPGCDGIVPGIAVQVYPNAAMTPWVVLSTVDQPDVLCTAQLIGRMSATPCFENDAGICDASLEQAV